MRLEDYDLEGELGRGAMGVVYRARHRATGAVHALKKVELPDPEAALRFEREATALARAQGPGLVPVHGVALEKGRAWLAMGYLPGGTLRQRLVRGQPWATPAAVALTLELARAVARCHAAGLVHRDLKPENILFSEDGRPHVADLGLVKDLGARSLTASGTVLGTPAYMAPEQLLGLPAGPAADVFALGAILHELLAGAPAFAHTSALARALDARTPAPPPGVAGPVAQLLAVALDPAPERRPADAGELARALEALEGGAAAPRRGRPLLVAGAALAGAALVVAVGALLVAARRAPTADPPPAAAPRGPPAGAPRPGTAEEVARALLEGARLRDDVAPRLGADEALARSTVERLIAADPATALEALARLDREAPRSLLFPGVVKALDAWATTLASPVDAAIRNEAGSDALAGQVERAARAHELAARGAPDRDHPRCVEQAEGLLHPTARRDEASDDAQVAYLRACARVGGIPAGLGKARGAELERAIARAKPPDWTTVLLRALVHSLEEQGEASEIEEAAEAARRLRELVRARPPLSRRALALCQQVLAALELRGGDAAEATQLAREALPAAPRPDLAWRVIVRAALQQDLAAEAREAALRYLEVTKALGEKADATSRTSPVSSSLSHLESARRLSGQAFLLAGDVGHLEELVAASAKRDLVLEVFLQGCRAARGEAHALPDALRTLGEGAGLYFRPTRSTLRQLAAALERTGRADEARRLREAGGL